MNGERKLRKLSVTISLFLLVFGFAIPGVGFAQSYSGNTLPTGVVSPDGSGAVNQSGNIMNLNANLPQATWNAQTFDVGAGNTVNVNLLGAGLINVQSFTSQLNGALNVAGGTLALSNPSGIMVGSTFTSNAALNGANLLLTTAPGSFSGSNFLFQNPLGSPITDFSNNFADVSSAFNLPAGSFLAIPAQIPSNVQWVSSTSGSTPLALSSQPTPTSATPPEATTEPTTTTVSTLPVSSAPSSIPTFSGPVPMDAVTFGAPSPGMPMPQDMPQGTVTPNSNTGTFTFTPEAGFAPPADMPLPSGVTPKGDGSYNVNPSALPTGVQPPPNFEPSQGINQQAPGPSVSAPQAPAEHSTQPAPQGKQATPSKANKSSVQDNKPGQSKHSKTIDDKDSTEFVPPVQGENP